MRYFEEVAGLEYVWRIMPTLPKQGPLRVAGICGSIRNGSFTRMALALALRGAEEAGAQTELIDLRDYTIIFCDGKDDESGHPEDVFQIARGVAPGARNHFGNAGVPQRL